ncbi:MAG: PDZ domain-containing protein [Longimicrobiales bacterium]|nr:PDZ domain-containing protein [Longimicrobiales bacterium]
MMRMIPGLGRAFGVAVALGVLAGAGPLSHAAAQVRAPRVVREACRCVTPDGKPIENCTCFTWPEGGGAVARMLPASGGRARLGITLTSEASGGAGASGAEVASVLEGGPADHAGIREGDVITRIDGKSLLEPMGAEMERDFDEDASLPVQRLMEVVQSIDPGQKVEVEYLREGERRTATVEARELDSWAVTLPSAPWNPEAFEGRMRDLGDRLGELRIRLPRGPRDVMVWSDSSQAPHVSLRRVPEGGVIMGTAPHVSAMAAWECPGEDEPGLFHMSFTDRCVGGLELVDLKPGLAEYFGTATGVLVADVHESSQLGLRPGDVILEVGDREATDPDRVRRILESYGPDETVTFRIMRQKAATTVTGKLGR